MNEEKTDEIKNEEENLFVFDIKKVLTTSAVFVIIVLIIYSYFTAKIQWQMFFYAISMFFIFFMLFEIKNDWPKLKNG